MFLYHMLTSYISRQLNMSSGYKLVEQYSAAELQKEVDSLVKEGWILQGELSIIQSRSEYNAYTTYRQALIFDTHKDDQTKMLKELVLCVKTLVAVLDKSELASLTFNKY